MALIYCPDCEREISENSLYCVHCGCPAGYYDKNRKVIRKEERKTVRPEIPVRRFDENGLYLPVMKTMKEASEMTGISYNEIRNLTLRKEIVYITAGNKRYINMDSLACYLSGDEYQMENIRKLYDGLNEEVEKIGKR